MNAANRIRVKCGKCNGTGRIDAFSHYAAGRCFQCGGSGELGTITQEEERRNVASGLRYTAGIVLEAAAGGNEARAHFYADCMIDDLFRVGTAAAREILEFVAAGSYYDADSDTVRQCSVAAAAKCRAYLVSKGRERTGK